MFDLNFYNNVLTLYSSYFNDLRVNYVGRFYRNKTNHVLADYDDVNIWCNREYLYPYMNQYMNYFDVKVRNNEARFTTTNNIYVRQ